MLRPASCLLCNRPGPAACTACSRELCRAPGFPAPAALDRCHALLSYDEAARDLLVALKFRNRRDVLGWLADRMAAITEPPAGGVVTWAPTSRPRRRRRGYDQAELLARAVARRWGAPCHGMLRRRPGPAQTGRGAAERRLHAGFQAGRRVAPAVIVVDDVITTGATLTAAGRALRAAGATQVVGLVAARTPLPAA